MAEEVTQTTITQAPEYLKPGIEKYLQILQQHKLVMQLIHQNLHRQL